MKTRIIVGACIERYLIACKRLCRPTEATAHEASEAHRSLSPCGCEPPTASADAGWTSLGASLTLLFADSTLARRPRSRSLHYCTALKLQV